MKHHAIACYHNIGACRHDATLDDSTNIHSLAASGSITPSTDTRYSYLVLWLESVTVTHVSPEHFNCEEASYRHLEPGSNPVTGYFVTDFSLQDLKALTAVQPLPFRTSEHQGEGIAQISEVFAFFSDARKNGSTAGLYMELKHPQYHSALVRPCDPNLAQECKSSYYPPAQKGASRLQTPKRTSALLFQ